MENGRVHTVPKFKMLKEDNVRRGFFEADQVAAVLRHLPDHLRPVIQTAYITGWRISEVLSRQRRHLDLDAGWLRLEPGETKNKQGRMFPLTDELRRILKERVQRPTDLNPWLFHHDGEPIQSFRKAWQHACREAGVPGRLVHDLRRTAVRNLERSGVPRSSAMAMTGHKTEAVYRRYAIVDEGALRDAAEKLQSFHGRM